MQTMGDRLIRQIIANHGVEIVSLAGTFVANFGGVLAVEVSEVEADVLREIDEEEN